MSFTVPFTRQCLTIAALVVIPWTIEAQSTIARREFAQPAAQTVIDPPPAVERVEVTRIAMAPPGQRSRPLWLLTVLFHAAGTLAGLTLLRRLAASSAPDARVAFATFGLSLLMAAAVFLLSEPIALFWDFRNAYWNAGRMVLHGPGYLLPELALGTSGFVNLPIVAYLFAPFAMLPPFLSAALFFALGAGTVVIISRMVKQGADRGDRAVILFGLAAYGPLHYSLRLGNTSHFVLLLLVLGVSELRRRRDFRAGLAFGLGMVIKPVLVPLCVYFALRGRFRTVGGAVLLGTAAIGVSLAIFGADSHRVWLTQGAEYSRKPIPAFNSQSLASFAARAESSPSSYRDFSAPASLSVRGQQLTAAASITLVLLVFASFARTRPDTDLGLEFWAVVGVVCLTSTVSWTHYAVWILPGLLLVMTARPPLPAYVPGMLAAAFVLLARPVVLWPTDASWFGSPGANIVVSLPMFGALIAVMVFCLIVPRALSRAA